MNRRLTLGVFLLVMLSRLCHFGVLWIEEAYPSAAAINILAGRIPYIDFWFDKPPLFPYLYTLWHSETTLLLRAAGAGYITLCAWLLARLAGNPLAGILLAFFLTFDVASAALVLGPDMLTLAPVLGALLLKDRPWLAGVVLALGFHVNTKTVLFLPLLWSWRSWVAFVLAASPVFLWKGYFEQVWQWGSLYASQTFVQNPWKDGVLKTLGWLGFHITLVIGAIRGKWNWKIALWLLAGGICIFAGLRFFPRYYFHLLPPLCLLASQGLERMNRWKWIPLALLLLPLLRFGPPYLNIAFQKPVADLAMFRDSQMVASVINSIKKPGDTIFVWGYRPDVDVLTDLPGGTPFLESQPLTGVFADRHLFSDQVSSDGSGPRKRLVHSKPTFIVDGLGRYNPRLAITQYQDLQEWLTGYREVARTNGSIIYRKSEN